MLASLNLPAAESGTIPPAARRTQRGSAGCHSTALGRVESTLGLRSNPAAGPISVGRYLAGGRSGLSAHFRAAGSRSGSSSQTRQT